MSDLSTKSYEELKHMVIMYESVEAFVEIKRRFPDGHIDLDLEEMMSFGSDAMFQVANEVKKYKIEEELVPSVMDGVPEAIDELCVRLLELLIEREKLEKAGGSHLQARKQCIPDSVIDYLIALMIDGLTKSNLHPPVSMIYLVRKRLGVFNTQFDKREAALTKEHFILAIAYINRDENGLPSHRWIAKHLGMNVSTISRYFPGDTLKEEVERRKHFLETLEAEWRRKGVI